MDILARRGIQIEFYNFYTKQCLNGKFDRIFFPPSFQIVFAFFSLLFFPAPSDYLLTIGTRKAKKDLKRLWITLNVEPKVSILRVSKFQFRFFTFPVTKIFKDQKKNKRKSFFFFFFLRKENWELWEWNGDAKRKEEKPKKKKRIEGDEDNSWKVKMIFRQRTLKFSTKKRWKTKKEERGRKER